MEYRYRQDVLEALEGHGVRPGAATPPDRVRAYLNDLYRLELRRLRDGVLAGALPRRELAGRVRALRQRYILLSVPLDAWTWRTGEDGGGAA